MTEKTTLDDRVSFWIVENPKKCILMTCLLIAILLPGLMHFKQKYDVRIWFRSSDPDILLLNEFEKKFGNDENLVVGIENPAGIFNSETIKLVSDLTDKIWQVHQVLRVDSLTNFNWTHAIGDEIIVEPLFSDEMVLTNELLAQRKKVSLEHKMIPNYLLSNDATMTVIYARLVPTFNSSPNYQKIVNETKQILKEFKKDPNIKFYVTGAAGVNDAFQKVSAKDLKILLPVLFLMLALYFYIYFRSLVAVVIPFFVILSSIGMTLGICFYLGIYYNSVLSILPGILTAISVADTIHLMITYFQVKGLDHDPKKAALASLSKNLVPTFLTSISTMIGFFSLAATDLIPIREMGILAGIGAFLAWGLTIFCIVPFLSMVDIKIHKKFAIKDIKDGASGFSLKCASIIMKYQNSILILFTLIAVISLYLSSQNKVNSDVYSYFKPNLPISISNEAIRLKMGSSEGPELVIKTGIKEGIKDYDFVKKVEELKNYIDNKNFVAKSVDIVSIIKEMNKSLHGDLPEYYMIPREKNAIAEQLFLYTMSLPQGMDLNNRVSLDNESIRMSILWNIKDTERWLFYLEDFKKKASSLGLNVGATGKSFLFHHMADYVVETFFYSITLALFFVSILMMIIFKSVKLGLLSLIPNMIPLLIGGAVMYFFKMNLNIGTALVASVCLGIAVDDTIHFLSNYYILRKKGIECKLAMAQVFTYTGNALFITTLILALSFGVFMFGDFIPNVYFGVLAAIVLSMAYIIDVIFLPALLFKLNSLKVKSLGEVSGEREGAR